LIDARQLELHTLDIHRPSIVPCNNNFYSCHLAGTKEYETRKQVSDPVTGGVGAIFWTITHWYAGIAQIF
jgi:hypothetical protein